MILFVALAALAAPPRVDVHVGAAAGAKAEPEDAGLGIGAAVELPLGAAVALDLGGLLGVAGGPTPRLDLRPELRWRVGGDGERSALSVVVGAGARVLPSLEPQWSLGAGVDFGSGPWRPRVQGRLVGDLGGGVGAWVLLGVVRAPREPEPEAPPEVEPPLVVATLATQPEDALVWAPRPICEWLRVDEAGELLAALGKGTEVTVRAEGYLPAAVTLGGAASVDLAEAPRHGSLVVVAWPGDDVKVGDTRLVLAEDATSIANAAEGAVVVDVVGGGRRETLEAEISDGFAVWVRASRPEPVQIRFRVASADIDAAARVVLRDIARDAGGASFEVMGMHSPEGADSLNRALAEQRAAAVAEALVALGVDGSRVRLRGGFVPDPEGDPIAQRGVRITPLVAEEGR